MSKNDNMYHLNHNKIGLFCLLLMFFTSTSHGNGNFEGMELEDSVSDSVNDSGGGPSGCTPFMPKTVVCNNGQPVWEALHIRDWHGLDCLGYEIVTDIEFLGMGGIQEWEQDCMELTSEESGAPLPAFERPIVVHGFNCLLPTNVTVFVLSDAEVERAIAWGAKSCTPAVVNSTVEIYPCVEDEQAQGCVDGRFDWSMLSAAIRNDCFAKSIRDIFVNYKGAPPDDYIPNCSNHRRVLE